MPYDANNPPMIAWSALGTRGPRIWTYENSDVDSAINAAGYITDGEDLGMKVGDMVWYYDTTTPGGSVHRVASISAAGAVTLAFAAVA
jgi:hypothetical protein